MFKALYLAAFISLITFNLFCAEDPTIIIKEESQNFIKYICITFITDLYTEIESAKKTKDPAGDIDYYYASYDDDQPEYQYDSDESEDDLECYADCNGEEAQTRFNEIKELYTKLPDSYKLDSNPKEIRYSGSIEEITLKKYLKRSTQW